MWEASRKAFSKSRRRKFCTSGFEQLISSQQQPYRNHNRLLAVAFGDHRTTLFAIFGAHALRIHPRVTKQHPRPELGMNVQTTYFGSPFIE
jgi:hypothetical protein